MIDAPLGSSQRWQKLDWKLLLLDTFLLENLQVRQWALPILPRNHKRCGTSPTLAYIESEVFALVYRAETLETRFLSRYFKRSGTNRSLVGEGGDQKSEDAIAWVRRLNGCIMHESETNIESTPSLIPEAQWLEDVEWQEVRCFAHLNSRMRWNSVASASSSSLCIPVLGAFDRDQRQWNGSCYAYGPKGFVSPVRETILGADTPRPAKDSFASCNSLSSGQWTTYLLNKTLEGELEFSGLARL